MGRPHEPQQCVQVFQHSHKFTTAQSLRLTIFVCTCTLRAIGVRLVCCIEYNDVHRRMFWWVGTPRRYTYESATLARSFVQHASVQCHVISHHVHHIFSLPQVHLQVGGAGKEPCAACRLQMPRKCPIICIHSLIRRYIYESAMPVGRLVRDVADKHQVSTQRSWKRPYGVGLLVAGYDKTGPHLFNTCPSGNFFEYKAMAIGARAQVWCH